MDETWTVITFMVVTVVGLIWYLHHSSQSNLARDTRRDEEYLETVLRHDIPRNSFVVIYERFPFDNDDAKYKEIRQLHQTYEEVVNRFLATRKTTQLSETLYQMTTDMFAITDMLQQLYDLLLEYVSVKSDTMDTFQDLCEEIYEWFEDIRRQQQAQLRLFA